MPQTKLNKNCGYPIHFTAFSQIFVISKACEFAICFILFPQDKKPMHIMAKCVQWARAQGHHDVSNRRYYPSPTDIKNISQTYRTQKQYVEHAMVFLNAAGIIFT